jgi:hypothetical protein
VIEATVAPIPCDSRGFDAEPLATMSANCVLDFLKPAVSALAILWAITPRSVSAFLSPLSEV